MNLLFAFFGYRVYTIRTKDDNNPFSGQCPFVVLSKRHYISSGTGNDDHNHSSDAGFGENSKKMDWDNHGWESHHESDNNHAPVPEPSAYALMLAGLLMLGFNKRRSN